MTRQTAVSYRRIVRALTLHLRDWLSKCSVHQNTHTYPLADRSVFWRLQNRPSKTPKRIPHPTAEPNADRGPAVISSAILSRRRCSTTGHSLSSTNIKSAPRTTLARFVPPDCLESWTRRARAKKLTSNSQTTTCTETSNDSVPRVFFLPVSLHCAIERREQTTPNTEISTKDRRSCFDCG